MLLVGEGRRPPGGSLQGGQAQTPTAKPSAGKDDSKGEAQGPRGDGGRKEEPSGEGAGSWLRPTLPPQGWKRGNTEGEAGHPEQSYVPARKRRVRAGAASERCQAGEGDRVGAEAGTGLNSRASDRRKQPLRAPAERPAEREPRGGAGGGASGSVPSSDPFPRSPRARHCSGRPAEQ